MSTTSITPFPSSELAVSQLRFAAGVPGFPKAKTFSVKQWGPSQARFTCSSARTWRGCVLSSSGPGSSSPGTLPGSAPRSTRPWRLPDQDEVIVLVILTLHARPEKTTANLLGPLVVNARTGQSLQAVLAGSGYEPQTPIVPRG